VLKTEENKTVLAFSELWYD